MDKDVYYGLMLDKYLDENNLSEEEAELLKEAMNYFIEKSKQNMGIGLIHVGYVFVKEGQNVWEEYSRVIDFIKEYITRYAKARRKVIDDFSLEFINYGRTQLVYVLTDKATGEKVTILAKQPAVQFGGVKREANNLMRLSKVDDCVVVPIEYYANEGQELYVTPYITQARCVASDVHWGVYVPEPFYRFEKFTKEQERIVNSCMIAKLVAMYDFDKKQGIGSCKLGGGDFMLAKDWELRELGIENTMDCLYLIAAREMLNCSFEEYLNIIRKEFSRPTINEDQEKLLINIRGRVAMSLDDIEQGIEIGKQIISQRQAGYCGVEK